MNQYKRNTNLLFSLLLRLRLTPPYPWRSSGAAQREDILPGRLGRLRLRAGLGRFLERVQGRTPQVPGEREGIGILSQRVSGPTSEDIWVLG